MRSYLLLFALSFTLAFTAKPQAGWQLQNPLFPAVDYSNISVVNDSTIVIAGGGVILVTTDRGESWSFQKNPGLTVRGLYAKSAKEILLFMIYGIQKTTDGGISYTTQYTTSDWDIYGGYFIDSLYGWAVGGSGWGVNSAGRSVYTTNGGATWIGAQTFPPLPIFYSVKFFNRRFGIAGGQSGSIGITTDGGVSWSVSTGTGGQYDPLVSVDFRDSSTVFALTNGGKLLRSIDAGASWSYAYEFSGLYTGKIKFLDTLHAFVSGSSGIIFMTFDGGGTWVQKTPVGFAGVQDFDMPSPGFGIAAGQAGLVVATSDTCMTWVRLSRDQLGSISKLCFINESHGWAPGIDGRIFRTTDGGDNWSSMQVTLRDTLMSIEFIDTLNGWIGARGGVILKTSDGGNSWAQVNTSISGNVKKLKFFTLEKGFAVTHQGGLYRTTDGGSTWTIIPASSQMFDLMTDVFFVNERKIFITGRLKQSGSPVYVFAKTTNGGTSWGYGDQPQVSTPYSIAFADSLTGCFALYPGRIIRTTDGGDTWHLATVYSNDYPSSIGFADSQTGWATGSNGVILKTTDSGLTWKKQFTPYNAKFAGIVALKADVAWAYGTDGALLKTSDGGITSVLDNVTGSEVPSGYRISQNYPNPFNPVTVILLTLPAAGNVTLKLYDITGRETATLVDGYHEAGTHTVTVDAGGLGLASGVYLYRMTAGSIVISKKMVVLK